MHQIYPDVALTPILARIVTPSVRFHLFDNDITPGLGTVLSDFHEMGSGEGYASVLVLAADFSLSGVTAHIASMLAAPISFLKTSGTPADAYGYFATDDAGTVLLWAARFDSAPLTRSPGGSWIVTPTVQDFSNLSS